MKKFLKFVLSLFIFGILGIGCVFVLNNLPDLNIPSSVTRPDDDKTDVPQSGDKTDGQVGTNDQLSGYDIKTIEFINMNRFDFDKTYVVGDYVELIVEVRHVNNNVKLTDVVDKDGQSHVETIECQRQNIDFDSFQLYRVVLDDKILSENFVYKFNYTFCFEFSYNTKKQTHKIQLSDYTIEFNKVQGNIEEMLTVKSINKRLIEVKYRTTRKNFAINRIYLGDELFNTRVSMVKDENDPFLYYVQMECYPEQNPIFVEKETPFWEVCTDYRVDDDDECASYCYDKNGLYEVNRW